MTIIVHNYKSKSYENLNGFLKQTASVFWIPLSITWQSCQCVSNSIKDFMTVLFSNGGNQFVVKHIEKNTVLEGILGSQVCSASN